MALKDILGVAVACFLVRDTSFRSPSVVSARHDLDDPIFFYSTTELACSEGYSVQEHKIVTDDGYILTVHRLPNGRNRPKVSRNKRQYHELHVGHHPDFDECMKESLNQTSRGFPILLVHGIGMTSDGWLFQGPGYDLAYILADGGYDVWLANFRGSFYTKNHTKLSPSDPKFWDFSFHEHAIFDLPATIDHILNATKWEKVGYVGMSMGTTAFFALTSLRPEYNEKIIGSASLAPVVFIKKEYMNPKRKWLFGMLERLADELVRRGDVHQLFPRSPLQVNFMKTVCSTGSVFQDYCYDFIILFMGEPSKLILRDTVHRFLTHLPAANSMKTLTHYLQNIRRGTFKMYDYGSRRNKELYGSPVPPDYPIWNITVPLALFYSTKDFYYDVRDVEDLLKLLRDVRQAVELKNMNHADFVASYRARDVLYPKIVSFFKGLIEVWRMTAKGKKRKRQAD